MYEHAKNGCKHIAPSEQPPQFQSGYFLNKPRITKNIYETSVVDSKQIGLEINTDKTKYMIMYRDQNPGRNDNKKTEKYFL
jgi:hypothetical protein